MKLIKGPREKLMEQGASALSDAELLAIFLRTGVKNCPVMELAYRLLKKYQTIRALFQAPLHEFAKEKGLGLAKYAQIQAALELGKRYFAETIAGKDVLKDTTTTKLFLKSHLCQHQHEVFSAIYLNNKNQVICFEELFNGSLNITAIHPRVLIKRALHHNAAAIILAHNHPSGSSNPSDMDINTTLLLKEALELVEIKLLDHFIVGDEVTSLVELGKF